MKKCVLAFFILMIWSVSVSAEIYNSPFGFSVNLPPHWLIVSREELKKEQNSMVKSLSNVTKNKRLIEEIIQEIQKSGVECYYNLRTSDEYLLDNITIRKSTKDLFGLLKECNGLSTNLSKSFGRPTEVYECGYKKMGNLQGFFVDFEGAIIGTRSFVFYFPNARNEVIGVGGNCKNQTLKTFGKEYESIINSFKIR